MEFIDKRPFLEQEQKLDVEFLKDCLMKIHNLFIQV